MTWLGTANDRKNYIRNNDVVKPHTLHKRTHGAMTKRIKEEEDTKWDKKG